MKRIQLFCMVCILLTFNFVTIAQAKSPLPSGFQGLIWGETLSDFSESNSMQDVSAPLRGKEIGPDEFAYMRLNHDNVIGGVSSFTILYFFWQDRFEAINAYSHGRDKFDQLSDAIIRKFGDPTSFENNEYVDRMVWTNAKVEMVLTLSGDDKVVHFYMKSLILEREKKRLEQVHQPIQSGW